MQNSVRRFFSFFLVQDSIEKRKIVTISSVVKQKKKQIEAFRTFT